MYRWYYGIALKHADILICHNYFSLPEGRRMWKCLLSSPCGSSTLIARSAISRCWDLYKSCPRILSLRHVAIQGVLTPPSGVSLIDTASDPFLKCGIDSNSKWIGYGWDADMINTSFDAICHMDIVRCVTFVV